MSLIHQLRSLLRPQLPVSDCRGDGRYAVAAVGEAEFQDNLIRVAGPKQRKAAKINVQALLVPDGDGKTIRIEIAGREVGRLRPADARKLRSTLKKLGYETCEVKVAARIKGGVQKLRGPSTDYCVVLDLPGFGPKPEVAPTASTKLKG